MSLPRIGYIVNTYPRPSHSFIRREIVALERLGFTIDRIAMRGDEAALKDPADLAEHAQTTRILDQGPLGLGTALLAAAVTKPRSVVRALAQARRRAKAGESSLLRQLIYLAEGAALAKLAKARGIDHLHAHFGTNSTRVAAYAQLIGGTGFSFTTHGPEEFDAPAALDLGGKIAASQFGVAISSYGRSQLYRWAALENWPKIKVIHCGIELNKWQDVSPMPNGETFKLVAIGRFAEQKGFGLLMSAFSEALKLNPKLHLSLVGDGELRSEIEAVIQREGMGHAVTLLGWQDERGVRAALDASHALVVPSFAEGLPVVVMEAMAAGRPALATSIAGIPELIRPGREGWLVPAGDSQALAEAICEAAETDRATLSAMGHAARQRVGERHDIDESAKRLARHFLTATGRSADL